MRVILFLLLVIAGGNLALRFARRNSARDLNEFDDTLVSDESANGEFYETESSEEVGFCR